MQRRRHLMFGMVLLMLAASSVSFSDEADKKTNTEEFIASLRTFYLQRAEALRFSKPDSEKPFALEKKASHKNGCMPRFALRIENSG